MLSSEMKRISLSLIHESEVALRPVNRQALEYIQLVESVRDVGVLHSILVRKVTDPKTKKITYGLVDGLQRFTAAKDAGLKDINVNILEIDDAKLMQVQIIGNVHKIETKPAQYTKQMIRILSLDPMMTLTDLAKHLSQSVSWVNKRLSLARLDQKIQDIVDAGKINLSNAYALATLPVDEQGNYVDRAITDSPAEFMPMIHARAKEIKDSKLKGRDAGPREFVAVARLQKLTDIKTIFESPKDDFAVALIANEKCKTPLDAVNATIAWVLHMDKVSVQEARAKDVERKAQQKVEKDRRKKERDDRKIAEAAATSAEVSV